MFDIKEYLEAESVDQAIDFLSKNEGAKIIAGGSDVLIRVREGHYKDAKLVGITRLGLDEISMDDNGDIHVGPTCTFTSIQKNDIIKSNVPYLGEAVGTIGGPQLRNVATVGGNLCNGATSADSASILLCLEAKLVIMGKDGEKTMDLVDLHTGPGRVDLEQDEILTDIIIEKKSYDGFKGKYNKFAQRNAMDIATIGNSVMVKCKDGVVLDAKIACGVAAPTPVRCLTAEEFLKNKKVTAENIDKAAELTIQNTKARDSWRGSKAFREHLVIELTKRSLTELCGLKG